MDAALRAHISSTVLVARERMGLTQQELAQRAGIHKGQVSRIESAERNVMPAMLMRIADALEIPVSALFLGENPDWHATDCEDRAELVPVFEHTFFSAVWATVHRPSHF